MIIQDYSSLCSRRFPLVMIPTLAVSISLVFASFLCADQPLTSDGVQTRYIVHTRVKNVAHRGNSFETPENTLTAYRSAIQSGASGAECDVYRSSDGVLFLSHDNSPKRTMGGSEGTLTEMAFEQIQKFDAGNWKDPQFKGEKVPTLDEYLKALKGTMCYPVIEIKMAGIEADVMECVRKNNMVDVTTIISFEEKVMEKIRRLEPRVAAAWLYSENLKDKGTAEENAERLAKLVIERCRKLDVVVIDVAHSLLSPTLIKLINEAGIQVWAWTVNDSNAMERYLDWGVSSITTDKPKLLSEILERRNQNNK